METIPTVRVDKWLWAVRLYKTRGLAAAACLGGKVHLDGHPVKPARAVRAGDILVAVTGDLTRTVKVLAPIERRVGPKLVRLHLDDLTPAAEFEKQRERQAAPAPFRPPGAGRPTKRDRRVLQSFFGEE